MTNLFKLLCIMVFGMACSSSASGRETNVFVLPVEKEIDMQMFQHVRSGLKEAREKNADIVIVKLNTFGGALDAADSIRTALRRCSKPTVAFVDPNAASAGALIALSCDSVFMSPEASMGSATVVNGAGEPMPEKYQQYMRAIMRATAESHGKKVEGDSVIPRRNPEIADRMVQPEQSISLTASQAMECRYAEGIARDISQILEDLNIKEYNIINYEPTLSDTILGFLANAGVRAVLITLILGAIYIEMHSPGLGVAAAVAMVSAVLFFLPMTVTGTLSSWVIICFILGAVLVALEIFVIPGFGVCGVAGSVAIMAALGGAIAESDSVTGFDISAVAGAFFTVLAGLVMAVAAALWLTGKHGPKVLRKHTELMTELSNSRGYVAVDMSYRKYIGSEAKAVTDLRPSGKIEIDGVVLPAVSTGEFIPSGTKLTVKHFENAQLYVAKLQ